MFNFVKNHVVKIHIYMLYPFIPNKKNIVYTLLLLWLGLSLSCSFKHEPMPDFRFFTTERKWLTANEMKRQNIVLIYFNTGCEFCQEELQDIHRYNRDFKQKNVHFIFVSLETLSSLQQFVSQNHLDSVSNWSFAHSSPAQIDTLLHTATVPSIFMYKNGYLIEKSIGQLPAEDILSEF